MKRLKVGVVNTLSFVKMASFTVNSFEVTLSKAVGAGSLTITNLTDLNGLDSCKDFIRLNIDLINNTLDGGDYYLTVSNQGNDFTYLANIQDTEVTQSGSGVYADTVRFTDL
jgi:putative N-acetylmannosamine-6-phosphate epimerase